MKKNMSQTYRSTRGNIFMVLFGAVGLVGVLGVGTTQYIRGPLTTATNVTRNNLAETQMMITSQVAAVTSAQQASSGDCDSDGFVEPLQYRSAGASPKPTGGGYIPTSIGTTTIDPWGTEYGYCVWDHGSDTLDAACQTSGNDYRLGGGNISNQPVIALVSAGKDKIFQTTCSAWVDGNADLIPDTALIAKTSGSDDLIVKFTYAEATGMGGGLWALKSGDPDTATIAKDLEVTGGAEFDGNLTFASGGLILPDQTTSGACAAGTANQMRRNTTSTPPTLEICVNDGTPAWEVVSGSGGGSTPTVVQAMAKQSNANVDSGNGSFSTLPTAGNAIIVTISVWRSGGGTVPPGAVTDNQGNTYTQVKEGNAAVSARSYIFAAYNIGAPSGTFTITVDPSSAANYVEWGAMEVSGLETSSTLDVTGTTSSTSTSTAVSTSGTTSQASEFAVAVITHNSNDTNSNLVEEAGWTEQYVQPDSQTTIGFSTVYKVLSSTGTITTTWTHDTPTGATSASIATFKAAASGGSSGTPGGNDTEVQYNDGGAFNGDTMFVWDETNNQLGVGSSTTYATLDLGTGTGQKLLSYADGSNGRSGLGANMVAASTYQTNLFGQNDGTSGNLSFGFVATSDGTTYTERLRLTQAGRLGIGVTAPDAPLEVNGEVILGDSSLACDASREGGIKYDTSTNTVKFCDGAGTWANIDSGGGGGGGSITLSDCTGSVAATPAFVQATYDAGSSSNMGATHTGTSTTVSFPSLPTAGNTIFVLTYGYNASFYLHTSGSITDNQGNIYHLVSQGPSNSGGRVYLYAAYDIGTPSGTFTITADPSDDYGDAYVNVGAIEVSGIASSVVDQAIGMSQNAGNTTSITTSTLSQADEFAVGVITGGPGSTVTGFVHDSGAGWTEVFDHSDTACSCTGFSVVHKTVSSTSAVSHQWSHDSTGSQAVAMATFKKAASGPAISVVQSSPESVLDPGADTDNISFSTLPTAGNTIIVTIAGYDSGDPFVLHPEKITDNQGGTYAIAAYGTTGTFGSYVYYRTNIAAPSGTFTITIDPDNASNEISWGAMEVAGLDTNGPVDRVKYMDNTSAGTSTAITADGTTATDNEFAVAGLYLDTGASSNFAVASGWTQGATRNGTTANGQGASIAYKLFASSGASVAHTWTHSSADYYQMPVLATFKAASTSGACGQVLFNDSGTLGEDALWYNKTSNSVGVGALKSSPNAKLDISGSLRVADDVTTCDSTINGAMRYNTTTNKMNYCDGTDWVVPGTIDTDGTAATWPGSTGYFVLTNSTFNGNRGRLAGANANCLTDLNANTWMDKATATTNGWIDAEHIQAFLCDSYMCQNPLPNTTYSFQLSNDATKGGATFTADSAGRGPGNSTAWSGATYFGATGLTYWTGRDDYSTTLWEATNGYGYNCGLWETTGDIGNTGRSTDTDAKRWNQTTAACTANRRLICMVHPSP